MKKYKVLKDFTGSQQGYTPVEEFKEGDVVELHDHLGEVALRYEYAELAGFEPEEAKVIAPAETKAKKGKK